MEHSNPYRRPVYGLIHATKIVNDFVEKYSRVTTFIGKKLGFQGKEFVEILINLYRYRNASWNVVRDVLKYVDKNDLYDEIARYDMQTTKDYLTVVRSLVEDDLIDSKKLQKRD